MTNTRGRSRKNEQEMKKELIIRLLPFLKKQGISSLKMEDIAKYMDISKATMYKYFSSRNEILESTVEIYVEYILQNFNELSDNQSTSFVRRFQKVFENSVVLAIFLSDLLLQDLKSMYPHLYQRIVEAQKVRNDHIKTFYEAGHREGVFLSVNPSLLIAQDELLLPSLLSPVFLVQNHMTLEQALFDYYQMKKHQLLKPEVIPDVDDSVIPIQVGQCIQKITWTE
ncbi:TetR/AcrR family transcriptional regulator [Brevibacillus laterosporus]|uniref:TetR/AcrR family transcriptional regulator n=1 Tax=Brevibacillus laterosporus TaxID=1465 RepID=A0AAP8U3D0_BRELA|nr:TetR/AcrR family transcriptional regulator [Brevibacillus laterosporus]MCR8981806.1 TetR/AcrR family transcriptional regulator [Brevibacillus laterosporus]MCZ0808961.1 TetR/AcrR family transcriptional regulator [Brevibacillus laterosporus]MCZ0827411.1 TetR/AcrR family transcriptional regulator [Brevibacillus laterosporus]MCZ0852023.1 TetR/AcrR family transcriptional regulator [Brevibacillus laterosporus]MED1664467.1 TetR/AcrR family transcriptional regulator [Brevibacillus laterosporus]